MYYFTFFVLLLISGCSSDKTVAGGNTGTEAGEAYGVAMVDGQPVQNAMVYLYRVDNPMKPVVLVDSSMSDDEGQFAFSATQGHYSIEVVDGAKAGITRGVEIQTLDTSAVGNVDLFETQELSGVLKVEGQNDIPDLLYMQEAPYTCEVNNQVSGIADYTCTGLPRGDFELVATNAWVSSVNVDSQGATSSVDTALVSSEFLMLEDWRDGDKYPLLTSFLQGAFWDILTDGSSTITPALPDDVAGSIEFDEEAQSNYLHVVYDLDDVNDPYVKLVHSMGSIGRSFKTMDSICVTVRGDGAFVIGFGYYNDVDHQVEGDVYTDALSVEEDWREVCVAPSAFVRDAGYDVGFESIVGDMNWITFKMVEGSFLDVGVLRVYGLDLGEML